MRGICKRKAIVNLYYKNGLTIAFACDILYPKGRIAMDRKIKTSELCRMALCVAFTCVSAYIAFPLPFTAVMITAQTFAVNLTALVLKPKQALLVQIIYTLIGIVGIPVFSGGTGGIGRLAGPSGGYIIGYIIAVFFISLFARKKESAVRYILATVCIGIPIIYVCGTAVMAAYVKKGLWALISASVLPFIPLDIVKCVLASYAALAIRKIVGK